MKSYLLFGRHTLQNPLSPSLSPSLAPSINMHGAGLVFLSQEAWEEGRKPHVAGVTTLPMAVGTPLIRGKQQPCEL